MRIAMWSGPRNLSTAMMYAFAARGDCAVVDEPFYGAYLAKTGLDHPMRAEILTSQGSDADQIIAQITGPIPGEGPHFYQKHMAHHMLPGIERSWMSGFKNVFLIRHPARVIASYAAKREAPTLEDIGFRQQAELFEQVQDMGGDPIVIDSADIRADPPAMLEKLCNTLGLEWRPTMLNWPAGGHVNDGVWASHWYGAVHRSIGFAGGEGALPELAGPYKVLAKTALPFYQSLHENRLI